MILQEGNILVCGDSSTDLPMLEECLAKNSTGVFTIWVTQDESLQGKVREEEREIGSKKGSSTFVTPQLFITQNLVVGQNGLIRVHGNNCRSKMPN